MISHITVKASGIQGTGNTLYDMIDDSGNLIFQSILGASFSGTGITFDIERGVATFTVSTDRLEGDSTPQIVQDGLQLYLSAGDPGSYPGSGTTWQDLSANSYSTTLVNGVGYSSSAGGTLTFDGANDYVDVGQSLAYQSFSVGAWFRSTSGGIKMILSKEVAAGNPWNYRIWLNGGTIVADMSQVTTQSSLLSPLGTYNNGGWHNVMFTRDDSTWYLYVNGQQVNTKADTYTGSVTNSQNVWIGRSAYLGGSYAYSGDISEVMIYGRVLSASEVLQNFEATRTRFGV
jgi:hypothetical protein